MSKLAHLKPAHLRLLVTIAETGKMQFAADKLAISQPAVSRILSEIEASIGDTLFERLPRGMRATPVGDVVLQRAAQILTEYDALENDVAMLSRGVSGKVRIGAVTGPAAGYVIPAIRNLRQSAPEIEATIQVAPSQDLIRGLERRSLDFVIARLPAGYDVSVLEIAPARTEKVALLVHETHPLAGASNCALERLAEFQWVMQERGAPIRQSVENAFFSAGQPLPSNVINSSSLLVALALLENSTAISPQAQEVADLLTGTGTQARLAVIEPALPINVAPYFVIRHRQHATTQAVIRAYHEVLAAL